MSSKNDDVTAKRCNQYVDFCEHERGGVDELGFGCVNESSNSFFCVFWKDIFWCSLFTKHDSLFTILLMLTTFHSSFFIAVFCRLHAMWGFIINAGAIGYHRVPKNGWFIEIRKHGWLGGTPMRKPKNVEVLQVPSAWAFRWCLASSLSHPGRYICQATYPMAGSCHKNMQTSLFCCLK
jgi:hypothetical protein